MNNPFTLSRYRKEADRQHSGLWAHIAYRQAYEAANYYGFHSKNNTEQDWNDFVIQYLQKFKPS